MFNKNEMNLSEYCKVFNSPKKYDHNVKASVLLLLYPHNSGTEMVTIFTHISAIYQHYEY